MQYTFAEKRHESLKFGIPTVQYIASANAVIPVSERTRADSALYFTTSRSSPIMILSLVPRPSEKRLHTSTEVVARVVKKHRRIRKWVGLHMG